MMIKKMWKKLTATVTVVAIVIGTMLVPASARGPVHNENDYLVLNNTWAYSEPKESSKKIKKLKKGKVYRVKYRCRSVTYKVKGRKKVYRGYTDMDPKFGIYGLVLRKTPSPKGKKIAKMNRKKGKAQVTGWWAQIYIGKKTYWVEDDDLMSPFSPWEDSNYFFVREVGADRSQTAGSSCRYYVKDFWGDEYSVSPWGYTLIRRGAK